MPSLKNKAIQGTIWTFLGYGSTQGLRLFSNIILTRLLVPEIFGLMSLVNTFRLGLELFTDVGIRQNIVHSDRGEERDFLDTAWTIQAIRGLLIWICICVIAYPISVLYNEPQIWQVLPIISLANFLNSFQTVRVFVLNRNLNLGKTTIYELSERVFAVAVMISYALVHPTVWALVVGDVAGSIFRVVVSYIICPGPFHKFFLEAKAKAEITDFGRWIFLSSIFAFLAEQSDRLIIGKLVPLEVLGIYSIAWTLANLPKQIVMQLNAKIIFPVVSKQAHLPRNELRAKILKQRFRLLMILFPLFVAFICFGDWIIDFLYDDRYLQAGWMLSILSLGGWFSMFYYTSSPCLLGIGKPLYNARGKGIRLVIVSLGIIAGYQLAGFLGIIIAIASSDLVSYLYIAYGLERESLSLLRQDISMSLLLAAVVTVVVAGRLMLGFGQPLDLLSLS